MKRIALLFILLILALPAWAGEEITILVALKDTPAADQASALVNGKTVFAEHKVHKGLDKAASLLKTCGDCTVNVKVAAGIHEGKGGRGGWSFPEVIAPQATLRILGGYNDTFTQRTPFKTPSFLKAGAIVFQMQGRKHALKEFYFAGFLMEASATNQYDKKTNSLLKGSSSSNPLISLGYLTTDRLVIADNLFMNSSNWAASPLIRAMSPEATVLVRNNFVMNNVLGWETKSASFKNMPASYTLEGNSFIMNWPYNPDPTTGNPAALEIGNKYTAAKVIVKDNLFAHNIGGAIYAEYADNVGPPMEIKGNLFFQNGLLFGFDAPEAGAVVGKFGGFVSNKIPWNVLTIGAVEDDFGWESSDNVVMDPQVPVTMVNPGFADSNAVQAEKTVLNDLRGLLGQNKSGGTVMIANYAPMMGLDPANLPFPKNPQAQQYGVSHERVEQF